MQIISFKKIRPKYNESNFIADGVKLIGGVVLSENVNIWFNSVVRADVNEIIIGENTNIQDLSMLHVTEKFNLIIGKNVTIGHNVVLHGCEVGAGSLIGMGATILDGAVVGKNCLVAAGSLVTPGKIFPDGSMIMGSPAKLVRALEESEINQYSTHYKSYVEYARTYMEDCSET